MKNKNSKYCFIKHFHQQCKKRKTQKFEVKRIDKTMTNSLHSFFILLFSSIFFLFLPFFKSFHKIQKNKKVFIFVLLQNHSITQFLSTQFPLKMTFVMKGCCKACDGCIRSSAFHVNIFFKKS